MFIFQSTIRPYSIRFPGRTSANRKLFFAPNPMINAFMKFWQINPESPGIIYNYVSGDGPGQMSAEKEVFSESKCKLNWVHSDFSWKRRYSQEPLLYAVHFRGNKLVGFVEGCSTM